MLAGARWSNTRRYGGPADLRMRGGVGRRGPVISIVADHGVINLQAPIPRNLAFRNRPAGIGVDRVPVVPGPVVSAASIARLARGNRYLRAAVAVPPQRGRGSGGHRREIADRCAPRPGSRREHRAFRTWGIPRATRGPRGNQIPQFSGAARGPALKVASVSRPHFTPKKSSVTKAHRMARSERGHRQRVAAVGGKCVSERIRAVLLPAGIRGPEDPCRRN